MNIKKTAAILAASVAVLTLGACATSADVSTQNNKAASDNFEVNRNIVFVNTFTNTTMLEVEGRCSVNDETGDEGGARQLEVICMVEEGKTKRHLLGLADNVSYVVEQIDPNPTDTYHYRFILRPETAIPNVDVETSAG